jgi:thymidylate synthase ThyX
MQDWFRERYPRQPEDSDLVYRRAIRAKAFDSLRGLLPAAALSNVGIYGSGQAYEHLILRMRAHPLPEARAYADLMLAELRKVIPSFLTRVDRPDRGGEWTNYLAATASRTEEVAHRLLRGIDPESRPAVSLVDWDPDGEDKVLAAVLYPHSHLPDDQLLDAARALPAADREALLAAWVGERRNRRHKPGRALERTSYRFDVLSDYGAFRDLQRHRLLTIQWQPLTPRHGYVLPQEVAAAGLGNRFEDAMARSAALHDALVHRFPAEAGYAVALAFRIRYAIELNARAALHLLELRSQPAGHPGYRRICQEMHRLIAEQAGHRAIAAAMSFVDHDPSGLERLEGERRAEARRREAAELPHAAAGGPSTTL